MTKRQDDQLSVAEYLRGNEALRAAVGAARDDSLDPVPLGMGEHNVNYRFDVPSNGKTFVLRVNVASQPFHDNQVAYEFAALKALEPCRRAPEPIFLDDSTESLGKGVLVEGFCEGRLLDFDDLKPGDLACAARIMADVHALPVSDAVPLYKPADPLRDLFQECLERFRLYHDSAYEDARITAWVERLIPRAQEALEASCHSEDCSHIVNTEPLPSHFLIRDDGIDGSGYFLDWERPIIGEVAQDIAFFTAPTTTFWDSEYLFAPDDVESFLQLYWEAVDGRFSQGAFRQRFEAWRMMSALRAVTWCCRALIHYAKGSNVHQTEKTVRKLPVYLSDEFMEMVARDCFGL